MLLKAMNYSIVPIDLKHGNKIVPGTLVQAWDNRGVTMSVGLVIATSKNVSTVLWSSLSKEQEKYLDSISRMVDAAENWSFK